MSKGFLLTESDQKLLRDLIARERFRAIARNRPAVVEELGQTPEVYIACAPVGGIPATSLEDTGTALDDIPGQAECNIYRIIDGVIEGVAGLTKTVTNLSTADIEEGEWVLLIKDKFGEWFVKQFNGSGLTAAITEINGDDTAEQEIGLLRDGTDTTYITGTPPAWSNSVAYKVGYIVSRLGVYYRCVNAHTNHQPPDATYWTVVTDHGLTIINIPTGVTSITVGTAGTDFAASASTGAVTINLPNAGVSSRGVVKASGTQVFGVLPTFVRTMTLSDSVGSGEAILDLTANALEGLALALSTGSVSPQRFSMLTLSPYDPVSAYPDPSIRATIKADSYYDVTTHVDATFGVVDASGVLQIGKYATNLVGDVFCGGLLVTPRTGDTIYSFGTPPPAGVCTYSEANPGDWSGASLTIGNALDRLAAAVAGLLGGPVG